MKKRKFLIFLFAIFMFVPCTFLITACGEENSTPKNVVVTLELNGGTINMETSFNLKEGEKVNNILDNVYPEKVGYEFHGWYSSSNFDENSLITSETIINANSTFYAKWIEKTYQVSLFQVTQSNSVIGESITFEVSYSQFDVSQINTSIPGYIFDCVVLDIFDLRNTTLLDNNKEFLPNVVYDNKTYTNGDANWLFDGNSNQEICLWSVFIPKETNLIFVNNNFYNLDLLYNISYNPSYLNFGIEDKKGYDFVGLYFDEEYTQQIMDKDYNIVEETQETSKYYNKLENGSFLWKYFDDAGESVELNIYSMFTPKTLSTYNLNDAYNILNDSYYLSFTFDSNEIEIFKNQNKVNNFETSQGKFLEGIYLDEQCTIKLIDSQGNFVKNVFYDSVQYTNENGEWVNDVNSLSLYVKGDSYSSKLILPDDDLIDDNNEYISIKYGYVNYIELPTDYVLPTLNGYDLIGFKIKGTENKLIQIRDISSRSISLVSLEGYYEYSEWIHSANTNTEIILEPLWQPQTYTLALYKDKDLSSFFATISVVYNSSKITPQNISGLLNSGNIKGYNFIGLQVKLENGNYETIININNSGDMVYVYNLTDFIEDGVWIKDLSAIENSYKLQLVALYEPKTTIISFQTNDSNVSLNTQQISIEYNNSSFNETNFTLASKPNYQLVGYALNPDAEIDEVLLNADYTFNNDYIFYQYYSNGAWVYENESLILYPIFTPNLTNLSLHIIYSSNNEVETIWNQNIEYGVNSKITITTTNTGYNFMGYFTENNGNGIKVTDEEGNLLPNVANLTDKDSNWIYSVENGVGNNNFDLYAYYTPKDFSLNIDYTYGGSGPESISITFKTSTFKNFEKPTRTGYTFNGFRDSGGNMVVDANGELLNYNNGGLYTQLDETTGKYIWIGTYNLPKLYPHWEVHSTEITFDYNYENVETVKIIIDYGETKFLTNTLITNRVGYVFAGFTYIKDNPYTVLVDENLSLVKDVAGYTSSEGEWIYSIDESNDLTLYAYWIILDTNGSYKLVNIDEDANLIPNPEYLRYLNSWRNTKIKEIAENYTATIQLNYKDSTRDLSLTGTIENTYDDTVNFSSFTTNTILTDGLYNYEISGGVDVSDLNNTYKIKRDQQEIPYLVDEKITSLIIDMLSIDIAEKSLVGDLKYYVALDEIAFVKVKVVSTNIDNTISEIYYIFDANNTNDLIGFSVFVTEADGTNYSGLIRF